MTHPLTNAHRLLDALQRWGVEHVFCCPGTSEVPVLDALAERDPDAPPRFILTTHEAISVAMADGYARASGRPAVAYLHTNVGLANGLAHVYAAQVARSSVALIVGIKPTRTLRQRALTTTPRMLESAEPFTVHTWQNLNPVDLVDDIDELFRRCLLSPGGPAVLSVPQDHLGPSDAAPLPDAPLPVVVRPHPDPEQLREAADLLVASRRVLIVAGSDVARRQAAQHLTQIARALAAPVAIESRRDLERWPFPTTDPHFVGLFDPRGTIAAEAEVVLLAGSPTPMEFGPGMPVLPPTAKVVHIGEDHTDVGRRGAPAVALAGETGVTLEALATLIGAPERDNAYLDASRQAHAMALEQLRSAVPLSTGTADFSAASAMRTLAETLGGHGMLVVDAVTSTLPLLRFLERTKVDTLHATASGSLGWGMGASLGVALATGERVIAVVGDGVLQFGVPALWTARSERLPVTFIVVNNGRYQAIVSGLTRFDGAARRSQRFPLTDISGVDAAAMAESFGLPSEVVTSRTAFERALNEEMRRTPADGPILLDVRVNDALWQ